MKSYWAIAFLNLFAFSAAHAGIMINSPATYTQNFDTLDITGTSGVTPAGWEFVEAGTSANASYTAGTGSSTTGNTYSFGDASSSDRAFGTLRSGSLVPTIGASFTNGFTSSIASLQIGYEGEQWRSGESDGRLDRLDFQYSVNATALDNGTWLDLSALDFISPFTTATGALNGNLPGNRTVLSSSVNDLNLGAGQTLWIRWNDFDATGSDDGLAIDNFSLTAQFAAVPEPSSVAFVIAGGLCTAIYQKRRQPRDRK